jgi:hypothetical protein
MEIEARSFGADNFPNTHFFCPGSGPGCGQIDKVDAGNDQNEKTYKRKDIDVLDVSPGEKIPDLPGIEMDLLKRLKIERYCVFRISFQKVVMDLVAELKKELKYPFFFSRSRGT